MERRSAPNRLPCGREKSADRPRRVAVVVLAACAVAFLIADGPRAALSPALYAIVSGAALYVIVKHPMPPSRWDRRRIIVSAVVLAPATLAVLGVLVWAAAVVPDWPTRLLALGGIAFVLAIVFWLIRTARKENQATQGCPDLPGG